MPTPTRRFLILFLLGPSGLAGLLPAVNPPVDEHPHHGKHGDRKKHRRKHADSPTASPNVTESPRPLMVMSFSPSVEVASKHYAVSPGIPTP